MTGQDIIQKVTSLHFPPGSFIVFGSCPLALAGIREANDIDLLVSQELFEQLEAAGWPRVEKRPGDRPLKHGIFEAHANWNFSSYAPTLAQLLASADYCDHVPFASLSEVRKWKEASGRPKDLIDLGLIDHYIDTAGQT